MKTTKNIPKKTALDASRGTIFFVDPDDLVLVDDDQHALYDARVCLPVDEALAKNIAVHGVIEPVIVTKDGDAAVVVDGRQRVKAAQLANAWLEAEGKQPIKVPVMIRRGDEADLFGVLISANEHRHTDGPLERAYKAEKLLNMGRSVEEVAVAFGVTPRAIQIWQRLLELSAPVKRAIEEGRITAAAAAKLHGLPAAEQATALHMAETNAEREAKRPTARKVAAAAGREAPPRMRSRKEIELEHDHAHHYEFRRALRWVLGREEL